ncbi:MAG: hypothetical protein LWX56_15250 [Ignavibacteria bacterium]|nr:hypothetical protein [Ignavibacteria bacterium]
MVNNPRFRLFIITSAGLFFLALFSTLLFPGHQLYHGEWQHFDYLRAAARFPAPDTLAPYCWRLLPPAIIHYIPADYHISYFFLSLISLFGCAYLLYYITQLNNMPEAVSRASVIMFLSMVYVVRINLIEFAAVDPVAFFFILLAIYAAMVEAKPLFIAATILGVLSKEIALMCIPFYFTWNYRKSSIKNLLRETVLLGSPAIAVWLLLRITIQPVSTYSFWSLFHDYSLYRINCFLGKTSSLHIPAGITLPGYILATLNIYRLTLGALGPIVFLIICTWKDIRHLFGRVWPIVIIPYIQIFIAGDNERLVAAGFAGYIILAAFALSALLKNKRISIREMNIFLFSIFLVQLPLNSRIALETYASVAVQLVLGVVFAGFLFSKKPGKAKSYFKTLNNSKYHE